MIMCEHHRKCCGLTQLATKPHTAAHSLSYKGRGGELEEKK